jgi:hypothetical protein
MCPECGGRKHCRLKRRGLFQCNRCRHQDSVIAGTIFQDTKVPIRKWFLCIDLVTQAKTGISFLALARQTGVSQKTA